MRSLSKYTAAKKLLDLECKISSLKATPGVINSVTPTFYNGFGLFWIFQLITNSYALTPAFTSLGK
jgi:hypothetical protein